MNLGLRGKVAVVTGAGSGIGLAVCRMLVEEGARVVAGDIAIDDLKSLADAGTLVGVEVDLGTSKGPGSLILRAKNEFDGIDILINCVGVGPVRGGFNDITDDDLQKTMDINFMSMLRACRAVLPEMVAKGGGVIVSVASDAGRMPDPFFVDYSLSKAAMLMFSKTISIEFGPKGVRSNIVSPGPIRTPMWDRPGGFADILADQYGVDRETAVHLFATEQRRLPLGRLGTPEEVAALCVFLASERPGFATGSDFAINGGSIPVV
ncbi:SDR family oxidoreductase [Parasphingopyxis algicola]|uniref:SDR family NAD(P)-dependent oxidoreductase n=1 Tax=Parasphingopyxis algicola TaxID=2026624 RepID=UPI0015A0A1C0|nr:SDR family oxidoreductase [Parasphingopyxis algicola]QLC24856.1 SDR family oxidoreductase [Parasphingopyxis algicola]